MSDKLQFIVDDEGNKKAVIIDYDVYLKLVEKLEDMDLIRAMEKVDNDKNETVDHEEFMKFLDDKINES
jgi:hypothetical protein